MPTKQDSLGDSYNWSIRPARPSDTDRIAELWGEFDRNGPRPGRGKEILAVSTNPDHESYRYNRTFCATLPSGEIVGFGVGIIGTRRFMRDAYQVPQLESYYADLNGNLHLLCVDPEYRRQGIGTALMRRRLEYFRTQGIPQVFGCSWLHSRDVGDSQSLFERLGFSPVTTVEGFYATDPSETGSNSVPRDCPACDPARSCSCAARIYQKSLRE